MEQHPQRQETQTLNSTLAEQLVGYPFLTDGRITCTEQYDIHAMAARALVARRNSLAVAVRSMGMELTDDQLAQWQPEPGQIDLMQQELAPERKRAQMLDGLAEYITDEQKMAPLRPHQKEAMGALNGFVRSAPRDEQNTKSGYVNMATGTGKTGVFVHLADALKSKEDPQDPVRILVLSPTQQILRQTIGTPNHEDDQPQGFAKFTPHLNPTAYYQDEKAISALTVMTNASFNNLVRAGIMPEFDAIIIDETHTSLGENISESIRQYSPDKLVIGFTATPDYDTERTSSSLLNQEIHRLSLPDAVKRGILAPVKAELRELNVEIAPYDESMDYGAYIIAQQKALFKARLTDAVPDILETIERGEGVILRCPPGDNAWYAHHAAALLREAESLSTNVPPRALRAVSVGGNNLPTSQQMLLIESFNRSRRIEVMSYVKLINMGTDVPPAKLLVNLSPTGSLVDMTQALGRVTRHFKNGQNQWSRAHCIDYIEPELGERQFTGLDVIGMRPTQLPIDWEDIPPTEELYGISLDDIGELDFDSYAGGHWEAEIGPDEEVTEVDGQDEAQHYEDPTLTFREAAKWFDIQGSTLRTYLTKTGLDGTNTVRLSDLLLLQEENPELKIEFADPEKHIPLTTVHKNNKVAMPLDIFARELNILGITQRLRNPRTGAVLTYVDRDVQF